MYYPFLRGKLFELLSLRELAEEEKLEHIIPIIEPVQENLSALNKVTESLEDSGNKYIFIYKTNVGELNSYNQYKFLVDNIYRGNNQIPGFIIDNNEDELINKLVHDLNCNEIVLIHYEKIDSTEDIIKEFDQKKITNVLHLDRLGPFIRRKFSDYNNIMLRDPFTSERRNADYAQVKYQSLSEDHIHFDTENFVGYSDFVTIGEEYSSSGFAPYAIAIHLTYLKADKTCWVQHFVSESNLDQSNIAGKYMEAMDKLAEWVKDNRTNLFFTAALNELLQLHQEGHYPGLGYLKKLQIKHHLELINYYFSTRD